MDLTGGQAKDKGQGTCAESFAGGRLPEAMWMLVGLQAFCSTRQGNYIPVLGCNIENVLLGYEVKCS
jgi:quinol-cytochrome oxidoreductase complex cytochrome b subunit